MENTMNENPLIIELTDENNEKVRVEIVRQFVDGGKQYVIANDLSNDTDCYILEVKPGENGDELISIDDEAEFNRLCDVIDKIEHSAE
jgi:uncharacterized protein YrzB (UPF0473 family)